MSAKVQKRHQQRARANQKKRTERTEGKSDHIATLSAVSTVLTPYLTVPEFHNTQQTCHPLHTALTKEACWKHLTESNFHCDCQYETDEKKETAQQMCQRHAETETNWVRGRVSGIVEVHSDDFVWIRQVDWDNDVVVTVDPEYISVHSDWNGYSLFGDPTIRIPTDQHPDAKYHADLGLLITTETRYQRTTSSSLVRIYNPSSQVISQWAHNEEIRTLHLDQGCGMILHTPTQLKAYDLSNIHLDVSPVAEYKTDNITEFDDGVLVMNDNHLHLLDWDRFSPIPVLQYDGMTVTTLHRHDHLVGYDVREPRERNGNQDSKSQGIHLTDLRTRNTVATYANPQTKLLDQSPYCYDTTSDLYFDDRKVVFISGSELFCYDRRKVGTSVPWSLHADMGFAWADLFCHEDRMILSVGMSMFGENVEITRLLDFEPGTWDKDKGQKMLDLTPKMFS